MIRGTMPSTALPSIGFAISASRGGKMSLPVSSSNYIYSHFKHVSGIPAPDGVRGVAITKLKVLDALIERLAQLKKQGEPALGAGGPISEDRVDALIEQYESQIRQAKAAAVPLPYSPVPAPAEGAVFSLVA